MYPPEMSDEFFWLEWLGRFILEHHAIPRTLGTETLTSAGSPFIAQQWLFAVILATIQRFKAETTIPYLVALVCTIPLAITGMRLEQAHTNKILTYFALCMLDISLGTHTQIRAEIIGIALFSLELWLLEMRGTAQLWIPLIIILCVNMHASGLVLSALPLIVLCSDALTPATRMRINGMRIVTAVLSLAASLVTPYGIDLWKFAFNLSAGKVHKYISEWQPTISLFPFSYDHTGIAVDLISVAFFLIAVYQGTIKRRDFLVGILFFALGMYAQRFFIFFILFSYPFIFQIRVFDVYNRIEKTKLIHIFAAAYLLVAWFHQVSIISQTPAQSMTIVQGLHAARSWNFPSVIGKPSEERVYCSDFSLCNTYLYSGAKVYMDGRVDAFPLSMWHELRHINELKDHWQQHITRLGVNVVVVHNEDRLAKALLHNFTWRVAASEDIGVDPPESATTVFVKRYPSKTADRI